MNDHDLTVMVDAAASGAVDSQAAIYGGKPWAELDRMTQNNIREAALPFVFHGTKALADLGYSKPRVIEQPEQADELPVGTLVLQLDGDVVRKFAGGWRTLVAEADGSAWLSGCMEDPDYPAAIIREVLA